ncbi:RNA-binding protein 1-like [Cocos nucifera]|uniref:RNA-binding protein 1-like n=1 Tax=Cocos nucifera TaxID=13894 RepID=A0A8K0I869_COCNU|nr:RNA-binding protein 1-like [Cocos nucifera]
MELSTSYSPSTAAASSSSSGDEADLFVGGISRETTRYWLVQYFSKYGKVAWAEVIGKNITGGNRGFAFIKFVDLDAAERVLTDTREHIILGKKVEVKQAIPKYAHQYQDRNGEQINNATNSYNGNSFNPRKVFVGGLPHNLTEDDFCSFFKQFGIITNAVLMHDKFGRLRGFGFIEFDSVEVVEKILQNRFYKLKDKEVEVKKAVPKNANNYDKEINSCLIIGCGGGYGFGYEQAAGFFYPIYGPRFACLQDAVFPSFVGYIPQYTGFVGGYPTGYYNGFGYSSMYGSLWF